MTRAKIDIEAALSPINVLLNRYRSPTAGFMSTSNWNFVASATSLSEPLNSDNNSLKEVATRNVAEFGYEVGGKPSFSLLSLPPSPPSFSLKLPPGMCVASLGISENNIIVSGTTGVGSGIFRAKLGDLMDLYPERNAANAGKIPISRTEAEITYLKKLPHGRFFSCSGSEGSFSIWNEEVIGTGDYQSGGGKSLGWECCGELLDFRGSVEALSERVLWASKMAESATTTDTTARMVTRRKKKTTIRKENLPPNQVSIPNIVRKKNFLSGRKYDDNIVTTKVEVEAAITSIHNRDFNVSTVTVDNGSLHVIDERCQNVQQTFRPKSDLSFSTHKQLQGDTIVLGGNSPSLLFVDLRVNGARRIGSFSVPSLHTVDDILPSATGNNLMVSGGSGWSIVDYSCGIFIGEIVNHKRFDGLGLAIRRGGKGDGVAGCGVTSWGECFCVVDGDTIEFYGTNS